ncbi:4-amino-4-deoxychorismate lyase [Arsukibacterium ikkense]|uniref:Aminodeoxychorismate lyase n=1 Tax=Arsukibacterium ikkense TaxID=336831 RepID=A0A0M2V4Z1_9GAMM|nr:aminodeoxychorismate lyase [Arsukibacterium ikkense]KKO44223.1 4-amino-4-deoxychorismate lyase [Arsukibacterium ikkense]
MSLFSHVTNTISINDRCFLYGDGFFSTVRVVKGVAQYWPLHLARLQATAARLGITVPDWRQVTQAVNDALGAANADNQVLKIQISRGEGNRGYSPVGIAPASIYISLSPMPDYRHWQQQGVKLALAELRLAVQPALAGLKHCNRLEQVLLKQEASKRAVDDLLVCDQQGYVTEAIAANLFLHRAGRWYTPELNRAGVAGVMRSQLLHFRPDIELVNWQMSELADVDAMVLSNALMGLVPVQSYNNHALNLALAKSWCNEVL